MADGGDAPADTVDLLQASDPRLLKHTLHYISYALCPLRKVCLIPSISLRTRWEVMKKYALS
jgi:hypothetical protein